MRREFGRYGETRGELGMASAPLKDSSQ